MSYLYLFLHANFSNLFPYKFFALGSWWFCWILRMKLSIFLGAFLALTVPFLSSVGNEWHQQLYNNVIWRRSHRIIVESYEPWAWFERDKRSEVHSAERNDLYAVTPQDSGTSLYSVSHVIDFAILVFDSQSSTSSRLLLVPLSPLSWLAQCSYHPEASTITSLVCLSYSIVITDCIEIKQFWDKTNVIFVNTLAIRITGLYVYNKDLFL